MICVEQFIDFNLLPNTLEKNRFSPKHHYSPKIRVYAQIPNFIDFLEISSFFMHFPALRIFIRHREVCFFGPDIFMIIFLFLHYFYMNNYTLT